MVQSSPFTEADIPAPLRAQLHVGVPADDVPDALRLANDLAVAYDQPVNATTFNYDGTDLSFGTCLQAAQRGAASVPCTGPHGAEIYRVASVPYSRFPDTGSSSLLKEFAAGACPPPFASYVGLSQEQTQLQADWFVPTERDWADGARAVACVLKPAPAVEFLHPARGSKQIFIDDFTQAGLWSRDSDSKPRCLVDYGNDETLSIANGLKSEYERAETGLLCAATPSSTSLDPGKVRDVQLSVTATAPTAAPNTNRVGFVCREGDGARYHLTVARDGSWRIEKKIDGRNLVSLASGADATPISGPISLHAQCTGGADGSPVRLKLWILRGTNAKLLGAATDSEEPLTAGTVGLAIVAADPGNFQVTFDDFVAKAAKP